MTLQALIALAERAAEAFDDALADLADYADLKGWPVAIDGSFERDD